jgi:hypothetical protein
MTKLRKIVGLIIIFSTILFYSIYYKTFYKNTGIVNILPDNAPTKIKPADNSSMNISTADNDTIYDHIKSDKRTKTKTYVLPPPEAPLNIGKLKTEHTEQQDLEFITTIVDEITGKTQENHNQLDVKLTLVDGSNNAKLLRKLTQSNQENDTGYKLQLGSVLSEYDAKQDWSHIQTKYTTILAQKKLIIRKIKNQNGKVLYNILAGNYDSRNAAKIACRKLKQSNQSCIVVQ